MNSLPEALAQIDVSLVELGREKLLASFQPGLASAEVRAKLRREKLTSNAQLEALYTWRDGTGSQPGVKLGDMYLLDGFYLSSLEEAVLNYRAFLRNPRWRKGWLPIFADGGGDFYVTEVGRKGSGVVRHFRIDETEHPIEFESVEAMLKTIAEGYRRNMFFNNEHGYLRMDRQAFAALAAQMNPGVSWWS